VRVAAARVRARELKRDLGAVRLTTWVVMRLNSLVRLILLFVLLVEATIFLDRFRAAAGVVVDIQPKLDARPLEVPRWTRFALRFDSAGILALKVAETTIADLEKTHARREA